MMPYQVYQLFQAERTKTPAEIRRADEQLGELSRAVSSAWQHATTRPKTVLHSLLGAVPARLPRRTKRPALRRTDYLVNYQPRFPSGRPEEPYDHSGQDAA